MSNFGSLRYFQTSLSLGVEQGLQKLPKFDINDLKLLFNCYILIPRKRLRKTPFKTQCPPPWHTPFCRPCLLVARGHHIVRNAQFLLCQILLGQKLLPAVFVLLAERALKKILDPVMQQTWFLNLFLSCHSIHNY